MPRKPTGRPPAPKLSRTPLYIALALCVLTAAVFGAVVTCDFVNLDDDQYVYDNPVVKNGLTLEGLIYAATTYKFYYWHPVTWLSLLVDAELYGMRAGGFHLTNLLIHLANVLVFFFLLKRMTGALWPSALAAALFAIHPLRVESVAWVAERKDMLSGLFWLLTMRAYADWVKAPASRGRYLLVLFLFGLALMSKPSVVTLPFVLLLVDYWPLGRLQRGTVWPLVKEKLPLMALSLASSLLTYHGQEAWGATEAIQVGPATRVGNAILSYVRYVRDVFWPWTLAVPYPYRTDLDAAAVAACAVLLVAVTAVCLWQVRRRYLAAGWLWFLGALVPMIGLVQVGAQSRADRFTYIPAIGLFILIAWGAADLAPRLGMSAGARAVVVALVIAVFAARSWAQVGYWKNGETLLEHTVAVTEGNRLAHWNLGYLYLLQGRFADAERHFRANTRLNPVCVACFKNLGTALFNQGKLPEALEAFNEAVRLKPDYAPGLADRALTLKRLGRAAEAIAGYRQALAHGLPDDMAADAHNQVGAMLVAADRVSEAAAEFQAALKRNPNQHQARMNLARMLVVLGRDQEALANLEQLVSANPAYPGARETLVQLRARLGAAAR